MRKLTSTPAAAGIATVAAAILLMAGCSESNGEDIPIGVLEAEPTATAAPTPTREESAASTAISCEERRSAEDALLAAIEDALTGYDGTWGFTFADLECEHVRSINPEYVQYPASAAKIVTVVAVLRAVADGDAELEEVDELLRLVMQHSWDYAADALEEYVRAADLDLVLEDAGVSEAAAMNGSWSWASMTAEDLALVWAGIVEGTLLDESGTQYLLELAGTAEIPEEQATFPSGDFDLPSFAYGQKAGYYTMDGVPYYFASGGYLAAEEGDARFTFGLLLKTENDDLWDEQRRQVFPHVVEHVALIADAELADDTEG